MRTDLSAESTADCRREIGVQSRSRGNRQMESQRRPVERETPPASAEEARLMIDRAERGVPLAALGGRARCHRFSDVRTARPAWLSGRTYNAAPTSRFTGGKP